MTNTSDAIRTEFVRAATWHGTLDRANELLAAHPQLAAADIHIAAILGDDVAVRALIAADPPCVRRTSPPYGGDALNYLALSKYLRLDPARSDAFVRTARALLDAGANPNTGFWTTGEFPEYESALYGAAGVAHHAPLTALLLERGADPNDPDAVYHAPETHDSAAMKLLVETGRVTTDNLALMLVRKADWHDPEGIKYLLERGANPNHRRTDGKGNTPLQHAVQRDNVREHIEMMLNHGGDPTLVVREQSTVQIAARRGRGDLLRLFARRGFSTALDGVERLIAACALGDSETAHALATNEPALVPPLLADGATLLADFAGTMNAAGVALLLDLGVPIESRFEGNGYFSIPPESTALHVASWRACHDVVRVLIARGANVEARNAKGDTPLALAVKACTDSYWTEYRSTTSVAMLLDAGADHATAPYPSGYDEVDALLKSRRA